MKEETSNTHEHFYLQNWNINKKIAYLFVLQKQISNKKKEIKLNNSCPNISHLWTNQSTALQMKGPDLKDEEFLGIALGILYQIFVLTYSRVHINLDEVFFSKILKKPSLVQKWMIPHMNTKLVFHWEKHLKKPNN